MGIEGVKAVALLLYIASGLHSFNCYDCTYRFAQPSTCVRDGESPDMNITCYLEGPQNDNPIAVTWYKRNIASQNWSHVELLPTKFKNLNYSKDIGNGTKVVDASLVILSVSDMDSGCYVCEACVTYVCCAPPDPDSDINAVRCLRGGEQCVADKALLCSGSTDLGLLPTNSPLPTENLSNTSGGGAIISGGEVAQTAFYGGIAVCLVLAVTSVLLIITIIVLCANKNGNSKRRCEDAGGTTREAAETMNMGHAGGTLLLANINSDGTLSSSGASSSCSGTLLTVPSSSDTLTASHINVPTSSSLFVNPTLPLSSCSSHTRCGPNPFLDPSHPRSSQNARDSNPAGDPKRTEPSVNCSTCTLSILSPTTGTIHHYHVLELRPVSEVGSDTATQTHEGSWGPIGLSAVRQGRQKELQVTQREASLPASKSVRSAEQGAVELVPPRSATECGRYMKLEVSTLNPKHDYVRRTIQAEPLSG